MEEQTEHSCSAAGSVAVAALLLLFAKEDWAQAVGMGAGAISLDG